jgi:hypothetical protein
VVGLICRDRKNRHPAPKCHSELRLVALPTAAHCGTRGGGDSEPALNGPGGSGSREPRAHFRNLESRYSEPQATRKKGSFEKLHFSLTRGLAQVSLNETMRSAISRLRLDPS